MYYVYILKSNKDGNLYIGSTSDIKKRIRYHNSGKVRSTKTRRPLSLVYSEEHLAVKSARQRENLLKSGKGRKWIKEVIVGGKDA